MSQTSPKTPDRPGQGITYASAGVDTAEDLQRVRDWFARHPEEAG